MAKMILTAVILIVLTTMTEYLFLDTTWINSTVLYKKYTAEYETTEYNAYEEEMVDVIIPEKFEVTVNFGKTYINKEVTSRFYDSVEKGSNVKFSYVQGRLTGNIRVCKILVN